MAFTTDVKLSNFLFEGLNITNVEELVGTCAVVLVATVAFEALKLLKTYLELRLRENPLSRVQHLQSQPCATPTPSNAHDEIVLLSSLRIPVTVDQVRHRKICLHVLNTLNHGFNFFFGYLLMLVVMTYNVWLCLALLLGSVIGYWIFGAFKQSLQLHYQKFSLSGADASDDHHASPSPSPPTVQIFVHSKYKLYIVQPMLAIAVVCIMLVCPFAEHFGHAKRNCIPVENGTIAFLMATRL